jgi:hypothetical protein
MVQPWLGIIGSFGAPIFRTLKVLCGRAERQPGRQSVGVKLCGATPSGSALDLQHVSNQRTKVQPAETGQDRFGFLELVGNHSYMELRRSAVGGFRLSTTSNLVRATWDNQGCDVFLGVGHVHRSEGELNSVGAKATGARRRGRGIRIARNASRSASFMWGFHYTHFFYAVERYEPFRVVATSGEFCLEAEQDAADCESIQFISGLNLRSKTASDAAELLLSYGVNDCEAKVARLSLDMVWPMMMPLSGAQVCRP